MHKAWPKLHRRIKSDKTDPTADRNLVIASRTWFCLYLFEHQYATSFPVIMVMTNLSYRMSYGTGRPAVLKDDESIRECRLLLQHPLAIEDDMRLVSTVELMVIRERVNNAMSPMEGPVKDEHFLKLREADDEFATWYSTWDHAFSQKYEDAGETLPKLLVIAHCSPAFYRQSLQIQRLHAELFHKATALRGINGPDDVQKMPLAQRQLALKSIQVARRGLDITVNSPAYREGMKYGINSIFSNTASAHLHLSCSLHPCDRHVRCLLSIAPGPTFVGLRLTNFGTSPDHLTALTNVTWLRPGTRWNDWPILCQSVSN
jgi:hypothetical protein